MHIDPARFASYLDSTNLRLDATSADIRRLSEEALSLRCACVMIYPTSVPLAAGILKGSGVGVGTVIGFPSGRFSTASKIADIQAAAKAGATEVDIVMDYGALRDGDPLAVARELREASTEAHRLGLLIKVITENCYLSETLILDALRLCEDAGVDYIKTSTGFGSAGAKAEHIALWARSRKTAIRLKAAGGIKTLADALALIEAGAERLGTSSAGALVAELQGKSPAKPSSGAY